MLEKKRALYYQPEFAGIKSYFSCNLDHEKKNTVLYEYIYIKVLIYSVYINISFQHIVNAYCTTFYKMDLNQMKYF